MKSLHTLLLIIIFTFSTFAQKKLIKSIDSLLTGSFFDTTLVSVDIYNLTKKKSVYQKNQKLLMHPASNMKIYTSAAGLLYLGEDYEFTTSLYTNGMILNGELLGNIFIKGGFDPDFVSENFQYIINVMKEIGINKINGNILVDIERKDSLYWGNGWMWDDDPSTDFPYMSSLNVNDNAITVIVKPGSLSESAIVETIPSTSFVSINNQAVTTSGSTKDLIITRDFINRSNEIIIKGEISAGSNRIIERINLIHPEEYFLVLLKEELARNEIPVTGELGLATFDYEQLQPLMSIKRPFKDVIINLNKMSDNLSAEMTILALSEKYLELPASTFKGLKYVDSLIIQAGFKPDNYRIVDGSGISHYNLVSAELTLGILKLFYYKYPSLKRTLENSFSFAGIDGTLRNRMKNGPAQNKVKAKTGTVSGVSTLSGYAYATNGDVFAFSFFVQNHFRKSQRVLEIQNKICEMLAAYNG
jgi:D-alanyl-D-alanine carboxypeptidase/D-alanyl-D-alanine-endopeptidase (penicillin-binding protein 4)